MLSKSPLIPGLILDIDDTLCDTSLACAEAVLKHLAPSNDSLTLGTALLKKHGMPDLVPAWQTPQTHELITQLLTDKAFLAQVPAIALAQQSVTQLHHTFPITCYLTSRLSDFQTVSSQWLSQHGFPVAPVICRPDHITAKDWKLRFIVDNGISASAYIDNEIYVPKNVDFNGKLLEIIRFKKLTPEDELLTVCLDWQTLIKTLI